MYKMVQVRLSGNGSWLASAKLRPTQRTLLRTASAHRESSEGGSLRYLVR